MSRTRRNQPSGYLFDDSMIGRDKKPWFKPPKWFKKQRRQKERSRARQALRQGFEPEPVPKSDEWDWN